MERTNNKLTNQGVEVTNQYQEPTKQFLKIIIIIIIIYFASSTYRSKVNLRYLSTMSNYEEDRYGHSSTTLHLGGWPTLLKHDFKLTINFELTLQGDVIYTMKPTFK